MKKLSIYYSLLFLIGFFGYGLLEIVWRGYTHPTMGLAGGLCLCFLSIINVKLKQLKLIYRAILGGLFITTIEFLIGILMNVGLKNQIWDYSAMPFNLFGQICLSVSVLWCALSIPMMWLTTIIRRYIFRQISADF